MSIQFNQLSLKNFKIYRDEELKLAPELTTIVGKNGAGKTSFLDAIKWVWYGEFYTRSNQKVPSVQIINHNAIIEMQRFAEVGLYFTNQEDEYVIKRKIEISSDLQLNQNLDQLDDNQKNARIQKFLLELDEKDINETFSFKRNDQTFNAEEGQRILNSLMPKEISIFFLFDGEQLDDYESLMLSDSEGGSWLAKKIEHILGIPAIENSYNDLKNLRTESAKIISDMKEKTTQKTQIQTQMGTLEVKLENLKNEQKEQLKNIDQTNTDIDTLEQQQKKFKEVKDKITEQETLKKEKKKLESNLDGIKKEILEVTKELWRDLVAEVKDTHLNNLENNVSDLEVERDTYLREIFYNELLNKHLNEDQCELCSNKILEQQKKYIKDQLGNKNILTHTYPHDISSEIDEKKKRIVFLKKFSNVGNKKLLLDKENKKIEVINLIESNNSDINDISKFLQNHNIESIKINYTHYTNLQKQLGIQEEEIKKNKDAVNEQQQLLEVLEKQLIDMGSNDPIQSRVAEEYKLINSLEKLFLNARDQIVEKFRTVIEQKASEYFSNLVKNPNYKNLRINKNFGLSIVNQDDLYVPMRSAGVEQMVSIALLSALNKNSVIEAPLIMDTSFGRLDKDNTKNSLDHLIGLSTQVVLLIHDDEVDSETLEGIQKFVSRRYLIRKELQKEESYIEPV